MSRPETSIRFLMKPYKKILIINIFGIGDVLFTTPMIRSIKQARPDAFIGYICNQRAFGIIRHHPDISRFHIYERDVFKYIGRESRRDLCKAYWRFIKEIRNERYDLVFDLSLSPFMNLVTVLAGIRRRVGYDFKNRSPFLTSGIRLRGYEGRHVVAYYSDLLTRAGIPSSSRRLEVTVPQPEQRWADKFLKENGLRECRALVCLVPGGGASWGKDAGYKRWPPQRWAELADKMIEELAAVTILMGSEDEQPIGREINRIMKHRAVDLIGRMTLEQYLALMSRCQLAVLHDGGPLHMAVAAGLPTVSLFGPVDEKVYGPYPPEGHTVVTRQTACRPCYHRFRRAQCAHVKCLNDIGVDDVFEPVKQALTAIQSH